MVDEDEVVLLSALEHYSYCPRQCALIHVEQVYEENVFTLRGSAEHARADEPTTSLEPGKRVERALPLWSARYGLLGKADTVEFHDGGPVIPVEYKHGAKRQRRHDDLQLCAQALCLEEMLGVPVPTGYLFYHGSQHRREVAITAELRAATLEAVAAVRRLLRDGTMPPPCDDARCAHCSLIVACQPALLSGAARLAGDDDLFELVE